MTTTVALRNDNEASPPWAKRKREPAGAYAAFVVYRDQDPPRSLARLAKALGKSKRPLAEWSRKYDWVERAAAWTEHLALIGDAALEDALVRRRREEAERIYDIGRRLQDAGMFRLNGALDENGRVVVDELELSGLDADEVARFIDLGTKLVRLSMGLPSELTGTITVSLTDVERVLAGVFTVAERHMDRGAHEAFMRECYAMARESLG